MEWVIYSVFISSRIYGISSYLQTEIVSCEHYFNFWLHFAFIQLEVCFSYLYHGSLLIFLYLLCWELCYEKFNLTIYFPFFEIWYISNQSSQPIVLPWIKLVVKWEEYQLKCLILQYAHYNEELPWMLLIYHFWAVFLKDTSRCQTPESFKRQVICEGSNLNFEGR